DISFATQSAPGSYAMQVGPDVTDTASVKMALWSGSFPITPAPTARTYTSAVGRAPGRNRVSKVRVAVDLEKEMATFTAADVRLTNPSGQLIPIASVLVVAGTSNRTFDITFATQTAPGLYSMQIGPEVTDTASVKMSLWSGSYRINQVLTARTYTS